jgi:hypothetical protein
VAESGEAGLASLWFASVEGRRRSGLLLLHCGRYVVLFAAGSPDDADLRKNRANHLLHWSIMRWAVTAGFEGYDLGGVDTHAFPGCPRTASHPLWNLYEFKRRLGAVGEVRVRAHEYAPNPVLGRFWRIGPTLPVSGIPGPVARLARAGRPPAVRPGRLVAASPLPADVARGRGR